MTMTMKKLCKMLIKSMLKEKEEEERDKDQSQVMIMVWKSMAFQSLTKRAQKPMMATLPKYLKTRIPYL